MDSFPSQRSNVIPWSHHSPSIAATSSSHIGKHVSLADVIMGSSKHSIDLESLPQPCLKDDAISIRVSQYAYYKGINKCKLCLHGRLILPKGSSPVKLGELPKKIQEVWKISSHWCLISLGKWYFEFSFQSHDDMMHVRSIGMFNLKPGFLRVFSWIKDFSPFDVKKTLAQVWMRIYDLPHEYWDSPIFFFYCLCVRYTYLFG